jgi:TPR repeat protein
MNSYGLLLEEEFDGHTPNREEALIWFKKSADRGNTSGLQSYKLLKE